MKKAGMGAVQAAEIEFPAPAFPATTGDSDDAIDPSGLDGAWACRRLQATRPEGRRRRPRRLNDRLDPGSARSR